MMNKQRIALLMPRSTFLEGASMVFPPLGLLYLGARLESLGHETQLFDLNEDSLPQDGDFSQIWVSSTAPQIAEVKRIARETRGWKTKRVLGGASVWNSPDVFKNLEYDLAVAGECDTEDAVRSILELAENPPADHYAYFPTNPTLDWVMPPLRRWNHRYKCKLKDADGNSYRMTTMFSCHDDQTEVLTDSGFKLFKDVSRSERLLTYNVDTGIIEPAEIEHLTADYYDGELIHFKNATMDCLVTPNHRMLVQKKDSRDNSYSPFFFENAEDASKKARRYIRFGEWVGVEPENKSIRFHLGSTGREVLDIDLMDFIEFLGYYLSRGTAWANLNNQYRVKIGQSVESNPVTYNLIEDCIKRMGFNYYKSENTIEISCRELFDYLKPLGLSKERYIPQCYKSLTRPYLQKLFDALQVSSGYKNITSGTLVHHYSTTSPKLAADVQEISLKLGYGSSVQLRDQKDVLTNGRIIRAKSQAYNVTTYKSIYLTPHAHRSISKVPYKGYVYCATTKNGTLVTRRNGKVLVSGNSRGCPMSCAFCLEENQRVLMADWTYKPIKDVKIGDMVMGVDKNGGRESNRYLIPTLVTNVINNGIKETIRTTAGDNALVSTPNHRIFVDDGIKTRFKRAGSSIVGKTRVRLFNPRQEYTAEYKRGWCAGYLAGDGSIAKRNARINITAWSRDIVLLETLEQWALELGCKFRRFKHNFGKNGAFPTKYEGNYIDATQCTSGIESEKFVERIKEDNPCEEYMLGWLAGMYDSDGYCDVDSARITQSYQVKPYNTALIEKYLDACGFTYSIQSREGMNTYCITPTRFIERCRPILKKRYPADYTYKSLEKYDISSVEPVGQKQVYDLTTETHTFICEGFVVHNCDVGRLGRIWDKFTRYEPLDIVEQQIKEAASQNFQGLMWYDDILALNRKRTLEIMEMTKKYNMVSRGFARVDLICKHGGYDFLKKMREGGTIELFLGVESASDEIKRNIHKGTSILEDTNVLHWCRQLGIRVKCSFILGLPGESRETMQQTRDWIFRERPDRVQVGRLIIFPSTPLSDHPEQFDLKYEERPTDDWFYSGDMGLGARSFVSTSHLSVDEIDSFWRKLVLDLKEAGIPS